MKNVLNSLPWYKKANLEKAAELDAKGLPGTEIVESLAKWSEEWEANK